MVINGESWARRNIVALVGFALNLVVLGIYMGRQQQMISSLELRETVLEQRMTNHHEDLNLHSSSEWRMLVLNSLSRLEAKIDTHIAISGKAK